MASAKTITRISPTSKGLAECERHYVNVHINLARQLLPLQESMLSYTPLRVVRQLDAAGGWHQDPQAWRFITLRFTDAGDTVFPESNRVRLGRDHANCLRDLRRTDVAEEVVFDRLLGQTALTSYLVELDRDWELPPAAALVEVERVLGTLVSSAERLPGIRRITRNIVLNETATEPLDEPGQLLTPNHLERTDKVAYLEIVTDDALFGAGLFTDAPVAKVLWGLRGFTRSACYEVEEVCGFDRRP